MSAKWVTAGKQTRRKCGGRAALLTGPFCRRRRGAHYRAENLTFRSRRQELGGVFSCDESNGDGATNAPPGPVDACDTARQSAHTTDRARQTMQSMQAEFAVDCLDFRRF